VVESESGAGARRVVRHYAWKVLDGLRYFLSFATIWKTYKW
jgi:hypothetical protein